jgi:hypothetical protein
VSVWAIEPCTGGGKEIFKRTGHETPFCGMFIKKLLNVYRGEKNQKNVMKDGKQNTFISSDLSKE